MACERVEGDVFVVAGDKDTQPAQRDAFAALPNVVLTDWLSADDIATLVSASAIGLAPSSASTVVLASADHGGPLQRHWRRCASAPLMKTSSKVRHHLDQQFN